MTFPFSRQNMERSNDDILQLDVDGKESDKIV
jgi:hypothetical protein